MKTTNYSLRKRLLAVLLSLLMALQMMPAGAFAAGEGGDGDIEEDGASYSGATYYKIEFFVQEDGEEEEIVSRLAKAADTPETIGVMPQDPFRAGKTFLRWVNAEDNTEVTAATPVKGNMRVKAVFDSINIYTVTVKYYYMRGANDRVDFDQTVVSVDGRKVTEENPLTIVSPANTTVDEPTKEYHGAQGLIFYPSTQTVKVTKEQLLADEDRQIVVDVTYVPFTATYDYIYLLKDLTGDGYTEVTEERETAVQGVLGSLVTPTVKDLPYAVFERTEPVEITQASGQQLPVYYQRKELTLIYDTQGGTAVDPVTTSYGAEISLTATPEREGYTFKGWYGTLEDAENFSNRITSVTVKENKTVYAGWEGKDANYTVVYMFEHYNNGNGLTTFEYERSQTATAKVGTTVTASNAPALTGDIVKGYELDATQNAGSTAVIKADGSAVLTVYYKLIRYKMVFELKNNNGRIKIGGQTYTGSYTINNVVLGRDISALWPSLPEEVYLQGSTSNVFAGWGGGPFRFLTKRYEVVWQMVQNANSSHVMTFTANWASPNYRQVEYYLQQPDGSYELNETFSQTFYYSDSVGFGAKAIDGYTEHSGGTPSGQQGSGTDNSIISSVTQSNRGDYVRDDNKIGGNNLTYIEYNGHLYRQRRNSGDNSLTRYNVEFLYVYRYYFDRAKYKIDYYFSKTLLRTVSGIYQDQEINGTASDGKAYNYTPAKPTNTATVDYSDYIWGGWYTNKDMQGDQFSFTTMPSHNVILYANWIAPQYTVTFKNNYTGAESENFDQQSIIRGQKANDPGMPTRQYYTFQGWYTEAEGGRRYYPGTETVTEPIVLYAHWTMKPLTYTVHYVEQGTGTLLFTDKVVESPLFEYNEKITENAIAITGYLPTTRSQTINLSYDASENVITFEYGKKLEKNTYTVKYVLKGKTVEVSETQTRTTEGGAAKVTEMAAAVDKTQMAATGASAEELAGTYYPEDETKELELTQDPEQNVIVFTYVPYKTAKFTVNWVDIDGNSIGKASQKESVKVGGSLEIETQYPGYTFSHIEDSVNTGSHTNTVYTVTEEGNITVTVYMKKNLTISAKAKSWTYNGEAHSSSGVNDIEVDGLKDANDSVTGISYDGSITNVSENTQVTTPKDATGVHNGTASFNEYYQISYVASTLTIDPLPVTISFDADRWNDGPAYDGTSRTIGFSKNENGEYTGITISSDLYKTAHGAEIYAQADAISLTKTDAGPADNGYKYILTVTKDMFTIPEDGNYDVTVYASNGELTIRPKEVTITVNNAEKNYDEDDPTFTGTVEGLVNDGDLGTISYIRTNDDEDVDTYEEVLDATYTANSNYIVTVEKGNFEIKPGTMTVGAKSASQEYNGLDLEGEATGVVDGAIITYSVKNGDNWSAYTDEVPSIQNVGSLTYKVKASLANYADAESAEATLTVTAKNVTITVADAEKTYGAADPEFTGSVEGLLNANDLGTITYSRTNTDEDVKTYTEVLDASYTANGNYNVTVKKGDFEIKPATMTVGAKSASQEYNGLDLKGEATGVIDGATILYSVKNGDNWSAYTDEVPSIQNAGSLTYKVKASLANYADAESAEATLTVTAKNVTITVADAEKTYGAADPEFTGSVEGLLNANDLGTITYSRTNTDEDVKTYTEVLDASYTANGNYNVTVKKGDFEIKAKDVTITVADANKTYGAADPEFTGTVEGLVKDGDLGAITYSRTNKDEDAKTYTDVLDASYTANGNYNVTVVKGDFTIKPASVILTSADDKKVYDGTALTNDTVTVSGDGFVENEGATYNVTGTQTLVGESDNVFTYTLTEGTKADNYDIVVVVGKLVVTDGTGDDEEDVPDELVVTKDDGSDKVYKVGETVEWTVNVKNIYDDTKTLTVTEAEGMTIVGEVPATLAAGESVSIKVQHVVTAADAAAGRIQNIVNVKIGDLEKTGDDTVEIVPQVRLTVNYWIGTTPAADSFTNVYDSGDEYAVTSPVILGYTADQARVSGTITVDMTVNVYYTVNSYGLTVNYTFIDGTPAVPSFTSLVPYGDAFSVPTPVLEGYTANILTYDGTMPARDVIYTVIYTANPAPEPEPEPEAEPEPEEEVVPAPNVAHVVTTILDDYDTALGLPNVSMSAGEMYD